ncbi:MAG: 2-oxoacid:acceptor oxidoreductase family protein, partial [Polyangiaceae bacterium]|nr:2-oxoacid:acceptor oxidoreductase family protein [Polyangiaceae bacterium]
EVHGMSQRGGAVVSHLRLADKPIHSDLVPRGRGTLVLAIEPLESLRYVDYLSPKGVLVASTDPFINMDNYGDIDAILGTIAAIPSHVLIPSERLARQAGTAEAQNMVMLGAASPNLGLDDEFLEDGIREAFARKGEKVQNTNVAAFRYGKAARQAYLSMLSAGIPSKNARALIGRLVKGTLDDNAIEPWKTVFNNSIGPSVVELLEGKTLGLVSGTAETAKSVMTANATNLADLLFQSAQ